MQTNNSRLALDIGTNSIGWAIYKLDTKKKPCCIIKTGVRIFSSGRNDKNYTTLNAVRRQKRLQRRQRDRYIQRRNFLLHLLKTHGLFPKEISFAKKLQKLNPYQLRAEALDLELDLYHFGRALFHLNQRRGFKSNKRSNHDEENGIIKRSIKAVEKLMEQNNSRTYGEFLWKRFQKMEKSRKKLGSQKDNWILARRPVNFTAQDNYTVYANREMIENEFNQLWSAQACFHKKLKDSALKEKIKKAIFSQKSLKQPIIGKCFYTDEDRSSKASPYFQKFRILKELNNLRWINNKGESFSIVENNKGIEFREYLINTLFSKKKEIKFTEIEKAFKKFFPKIEDFSGFNLDTYNRDKLEGNKTSCILRKEISEWDKWSLAQQNEFVELLEGKNEKDKSIKEDEEILKDLQEFSINNQFSLDQNILQNCIQMSVELTSGHGKYSQTAIQKTLPFLEKGELEDKAVLLAGWRHSDRKPEGELANTLPKYQDILKDHCIEMSLKPDKNKPYDTFRISNPTVHIAFNQLRLVVNDIIRLYGKPFEIVIETARDLPLSQIGKRSLEKKQKEDKDKNDEARQCIKEFNLKDNRENRIRYQLWKEQKNTCIYSGKKISKTKLYKLNLEIDHILPYSKTLDDSYMNKVLVYKQASQGKGNQTPYEYFSSDTKQWQEILERTKELPKTKQSKFHKDSMKNFLGRDKSFLERQLNDTRYISKYAKQYLEHICPTVWTVRGQTTALIRRILRFEEKNREDHRNHAKDALAIGLIDRSLVKKISEKASQLEGQHNDRLENIKKAIKNDILPWKSFKKDEKSSIEQIVVSHRKRTKTQGQLHNETAYGGIQNVTDFSKAVRVLHYVSIMELDRKKIDRIVSEKIKKDFQIEHENTGQLSKEFLQEYHKQTGIRRIRLKEKNTVVPIKNKQGQIYKAFKPDGNFAMELFENTKREWDGKVITRFSANQNNSKAVINPNKIMINDMLYFQDKFWRVVKLNKSSKRIAFSEHFEANVSARDRDASHNYKYTNKSLKQLQKLNAKKVHISPSGKYKLVNFNNLKKKDIL